MLIENTLFGTKDKVKIAIDRLKEFEPSEGYLLAFSGGKDSVVVYDLTKKSGVKFEVYMSLTTVDPPELLRFVKQNYPEVKLLKPATSMYKLIIKHKFPPTRTIRYCCEALKETQGHNRFILTGIRWEESVKRRNRKMVEICQKYNTRMFLHPIIDWTEKEVWEYIKFYNVKYCELYDKGRKRIGCILCPLSNIKDKLRDIKDYPKFYNMYLKAFEKILPYSKRWKTKEDMMKWWIYGYKDEGYKDGQCSFYFFE